MPIIVHNSDIKSEISVSEEGLILSFSDPAYVRGEQVLVDAEKMIVGILLHEGYHEIGNLPENADIPHILSKKHANMVSNLSNGDILSLFVPITRSKLQ